MSEKRNAIFTIGIIAALLLIFTVADVIKGDRVFSETENRVLASKPELSKEALFAGEYTEDYETYVTDQFIGRDKWIAVKTVTDILLQKKEINGVYLGADGYLIEQHLPDAYPAETEERRLEQLSSLVERWDATVMLVPTADNILADKLPDNAIYYDQKGFLDKVKAVVGEENFVDVYDSLQAHRGEDIYYRTDHHWNTMGAFYGYDAWRKHTKKVLYIVNPERMKTVTDSFLGTLHSRVNLPMATDEIRIMEELPVAPISVTYDFSETTDSFYEESHLKTKNKYGYFLDDNHAFVEIHTTNKNGKALFVIKDSYANCTIPMLAQHYEKVYVLDLRYYNGRLTPFMEQYGAPGEMDVLVLYNCIHFLDDFKFLE